MRLRTRLMAATLLFTFVLTVALSLVFLSELLRQRISQTESTNGVLLHELLAATRVALQRGLDENPPETPGAAAFDVAVQAALENEDELNETLNGFVRYSPDMQDAYVCDAHGRVLVSTNPALVGSTEPKRRSFAAVRSSSLRSQRRLVFGAPETMDISLPLDRNGAPFLVAHLGIRSTFLRNTYAPWLRDATVVCIFALAGSLLVAGAISAAALRPIEQIGRELEVLSGRGRASPAPSRRGSSDAVERVSSTISRLNEQMRTSEQTRTEMETNLDSMLQTLKDGVMLFTADMRLATASTAVANFLPGGVRPVAGTSLASVFPESSIIGSLLSTLIAERRSVQDLPLTLEDGRTIEISLACGPGSGMGALVTLHDVAAQEALERELQVSRRLASIGRLTANVGHEVKNPINAMVVHLELLRGKLEHAVDANGAQRHVEVLASEMSRLDRVVQTLADFSRPMEPSLKEQDVLPIIEAVAHLIAEEAKSHNIVITVEQDDPASPVRILCDAELLRQALLNIALNAMQSMPQGGALRIHVSRDRNVACVSLRDTGVGIPAEKLNRIFDLYFTTKASGSGIGLAMTYRIVQLHGGVIEVKSEDEPTAANRGSTFTLRLPLAVRSPQSPQNLAVSA